MLVHVKVTAGARHELVAETTKTLLISVRQTAQDNWANRRVMDLVAKHYNVPVSDVWIIAGHHKPNKVLSVNQDEKKKPR